MKPEDRTPEQKALGLRAGLCQIPRDGLERLRAYIEAGKPLLLDGRIHNHEYG